jgi:hypothetical protein
MEWFNLKKLLHCRQLVNELVQPAFALQPQHHVSKGRAAHQSIPDNTDNHGSPDVSFNPDTFGYFEYTEQSECFIFRAFSIEPNNPDNPDN